MLYNSFMTVIEYTVGGIVGEIAWEASEYFGELAGRDYYLGKMEAAEIVKLTDLSVTARILLSAVAGAIIQRLLDQGITAEKIFSQGIFTVK